MKNRVYSYLCLLLVTGGSMAHASLSDLNRTPRDPNKDPNIEIRIFPDSSQTAATTLCPCDSVKREIGDPTRFQIRTEASANGKNPGQQ